MSEYRQKYKSGDLVRVFSFPFDPTTIRSTDKSRSKPRPAIVLGESKDGINAIPVMGIKTKMKKTEIPTYTLYQEEVKVPKGIPYGSKDLMGVIKTDRVETFKREEISGAIGHFPLRTKIDVLSTYEEICAIDLFKNKLDRFGNNHEEVMKDFKSSIIAEKLGFLEDHREGNKFEFLKDNQFTLSHLQKTGKFKNLSIYSIRLKSEKESFLYNIATFKDEERLLRDWGKSKSAKQWLKEDAKYHALNKNIDQEIRLDPSPHPDRYLTFQNFKKQVFKKRNHEMER